MLAAQLRDTFAATDSVELTGDHRAQLQPAALLGAARRGALKAKIGIAEQEDELKRLQTSLQQLEARLQQQAQQAEAQAKALRPGVHATESHGAPGARECPQTAVDCVLSMRHYMRASCEAGERARDADGRAGPAVGRYPLLRL